MEPTFTLQCPIPISDYPVITLAHGGGGRLTQMLIDRMFVPAFGPQPGGGHDGAIISFLEFGATVAPTEGEDVSAIIPSIAGSARTTNHAPRTTPRLAFSTDSFVVSPRFSPAAISARWQCTGRSTTWRCAAPGR